MTADEKAILPVSEWSRVMNEAADGVRHAGKTLLETHRKSSEKAERVAREWRLEERIDSEHKALAQLIDAATRILRSVHAVAEGLRGEADPLESAMAHCRAEIDASLPRIEEAFLTARHCALDLLSWTTHAGAVEGSKLPDEYRESYQALTSFNPSIRPELERLKNDLLDHHSSGAKSASLQPMILALSRYNGVVDAARGFVESVVNPPLEFVFHDTDTFQRDWDQLDADKRAFLATEFNDFCQLYLYDTKSFHQRVRVIEHALAGELDGSLYVFEIDDDRVVFTLDEDPLFGQLNITLFRIVSEDELPDACRSLAATLYRDLSDET